MRIFLISLFSLVSVFANDFDQLEINCDHYTELNEKIAELRGEVELLESRYQSYSENLENELEAVGKEYQKVRETLIRLRKTPAIGYEAIKNDKVYAETKKDLIPVRKKLLRLQKQGKEKLATLEAAFQGKQQQLKVFESEKNALMETVKKQLIWAKEEVLNSKRDLLSALKSRRKDLDKYQEAYKNASLRYKEWKESYNTYFNEDL